uniref:Uncharacterized protein n=1 Tax=viral metagenome TaxID=1070528 RepID=A0A6C0BHN8_9ZZZZ
MRDFFGFQITEVAMLAVLLMASMPLIRATMNGTALPLVFGAITAATLFGLRKAAHMKISFGLQALIVLLVALIFVPMPFRGKRVWEGFEDTEAAEDEMEEELPVDVAALNAVTSEAGPTSEEFKANKEKKDILKSDQSAGLAALGTGLQDLISSGPPQEEPKAHDLKELGEQYASPNKKFRLPSEKGDGEHHLDSGTTFMNAYKQLKPEQINALTNDTQKLIAVQKDLMSNLSNLKPLISDGKEIMKTFKSFFGSDPTAN